jgi:hypothetical protein
MAIGYNYQKDISSLHSDIFICLEMLFLQARGYNNVKGTVTRDFRPSCFLTYQFTLGH